jgi:tetratricopeptide (TPR) repeat protein
MYSLNQLTPGSVETGLEYFHEAVRLDPADPYAYAGLALGYLEIAHGPLDPGDALTKAEAAANQAFMLDSTLAEVYSALAEVYLYLTWEFDKAEKYFLKAIEINPNFAMAHYHYSWALFLWGRMDEAIYEHKLAQLYDPFNPLQTAWLAALYCYDGQYEKAITTALESFEIQEDYVVGHYVLGITYSEMGEHEKAIEAHKKLVELYPVWSWSLAYTYAMAGHMEESEQILTDMKEADLTSWIANGMTIINSALGRLDEAFRYLNYEPHHSWTAWAAVMPEYENLRDDPRFDTFLDRLNLPD